jgi:hypothetical protein
MDLILIGNMKLDEAQSLEIKLKNLNVQIVLNHNSHTCTRGCAVTVEVLANANDLQVIREVLMEDIYKSLKGHEINWEVITKTFDPEKETAQCPACGSVFPTTMRECPECGLNFN